MAQRRAPQKTTAAVQSPGQSTRETLLDVTVGLIDARGEWGVKLEDVLEQSGASASSVYHHFGNLRGLVEEAQVRRFMEARYFDVVHFRDGVASVSTRAELRALLDSYLRGLIAESRRSGRARRLSALASSQHNPEMRARLSGVERESLDDIVAGLGDLQERGLIGPDVDTVAVAAVASGMLFSRSLTELIGDATLQDRWDETVVRIVMRELGLGD